jgi:DNA helicase-2/ATP-dependent DNA helicase PcrA
MYLAQHNPQVLKYSESDPGELNFGESKGLGFPRVLIYPTKKIGEFLRTGDILQIETVLAKFYVAITRARYSVGIVMDFDEGEYVPPLKKYCP